MEKETNCKISIRGKGAVKSTANEGSDEELHVVITGTNLEEVEKAEAMVAELLVPIDDSLNPHKAKIYKMVLSNSMSCTNFILKCTNTIQIYSEQNCS